MSEARFTVGDADADLAERLDQEISALNAATGTRAPAPRAAPGGQGAACRWLAR